MRDRESVGRGDSARKTIEILSQNTEVLTQSSGKKKLCLPLRTERKGIDVWIGNVKFNENQVELGIALATSIHPVQNNEINSTLLNEMCEAEQNLLIQINICMRLSSN